MNRQIPFNRRDEIGFAMKHSAPDSVGGQVAEEAFHPVEPGLDFGVFVRGVVVADHMDLPMRRHCLLHQIQKADPLLMPVLLHAGADDFARGDVQCRKQ